MTVARIAHPDRQGDEDGSALVIALVFLLLVGVLVAALVGLSTPSLVTTRVVKNLDDTVAAADAGVEYGIQTLRSDSTRCSAPSRAVTLPRMPDVNGHPVHVTCQTVQGYAAGTFGAAVIANDSLGTSIASHGRRSTSIIGPVFSAGGWDLDQLLTVSQGDVYAQRDCPTPLLSVIGPPYAEKCATTRATPDPAPTPTLPTTVPGPALTPTTAGTCTTLYPGRYTAPPPLTNDVYMASGVYYFDNVGQLNVGRTLFGGQPAPGESHVTTTGGACRSFDPPGADGEGVEIILGGNTRIDVGSQSTVELYSRTPATDDGSSPAVTLYQVPPGLQGWDQTTLSPDVAFLTMGNAAPVSGAIHGAVYGPNGSVMVVATDAAQAVLNNGVDVFDLNMQSSAANGLVISIGGVTPGSRYTVLTSTAAGVSGQQSVVSRAVVQIMNDPSRTAKVDSWRTCTEPQSCVAS